MINTLMTLRNSRSLHLVRLTHTTRTRWSELFSAVEMVNGEVVLDGYGPTSGPGYKQL